MQRLREEKITRQTCESRGISRSALLHCVQSRRDVPATELARADEVIE